MYGSKVIRSAYAELILEAIEGGGMLIMVASEAEGRAQLNLSAAQVAEMRQWMDTDRGGSGQVSRDVARVLEASNRNRAELDGTE